MKNVLKCFIVIGRLKNLCRNRPHFDPMTMSKRDFQSIQINLWKLKKVKGWIKVNKNGTAD